MSDQYSLDVSADSIRLREAWERALRRLKEEVSDSYYQRFLKPLQVGELDEDTAVFDAPGAFVYEWVREKFLGRIQALLSDELGFAVSIDLRKSSRERPPLDPATSIVGPVASQESPGKFRPVEKYRFETFISGQSNRLALAGAKAVAAAPGEKYNPLFIYGAPGLGKTHLLHAIARKILERDPQFSLVYVSAQQFAEDFVQALQNNRIDQFRRAQRSVNVWLVDDVQFIAGKDRTQEEVFHTFNHLHQTGKQIVLCSDRPPRELHLLDERLRSRFESSLVADIQPPDTPLRCAILLSKAKQEGVELPHDVAMVLADSVPGNIRILEGALTKLVAQSSLDHRPIDVALANELVAKYYQSGGLARPSFGQIVDAVGKHFNIPSDDIKGTSRKAPIAHARHVAVYITREITKDSWKHIGGLFGDRDHTSMMHAYQKVSELVSRDRDLQAAVRMLIRNLYPDA
ncbi:MAG TPA: chromosomal replication initiator protein DnaA [Fimbriimonadaceae bacterium]|nr:chromosomal replication initiator protein DnaA [Fimbriimonadaceae bacterium]HRJ96040.1 chromosomal replication initiator protein DnaA [Fimbriimonadaceae bacterium]